MHAPTSKHLFRIAILLVLSAVTALAVSAQEPSSTQKTSKKKLPPYALIFGTVFDAHDRPVYGVPVTIHPTDKKKPKWELTSDHQGEFAQRVPAGSYVVSAEAKIKGKKPQTIEKTVHVEIDERIDISLHLTE